MLTLTGIIRAAVTVGGGVNRKTGEKIPERAVVQVEGVDSRGLVQVYTLTVPSLDAFEERIGDRVTVPVRAWAQSAVVNLSYEASK
jgi:hypothetical protein